MPKDIYYVPNTPRGCGDLQDDAIYLMGIPSPVGTLPTAVLIDPAIPVDFPHFRGWRYVHQSAVAMRLATITWWAETSLTTEQTKERLHAEMDIFGMPWRYRVAGGIYKAGMDRAEMAAYYRYTLPLYTFHIDIIPDIAAVTDWSLVEDAENIRALIDNRDTGCALAATWRAWLLKDDKTVEGTTATAHVILTLAGQAELEHFLTIALDPPQLPAFLRPPKGGTPKGGTHDPQNAG